MCPPLHLALVGVGRGALIDGRSCVYACVCTRTCMRVGWTRVTGFEGLLAAAARVVRLLPGVDTVIERVLAGEVDGAVKTLTQGNAGGANACVAAGDPCRSLSADRRVTVWGGEGPRRVLAIPEKGVPAVELLRMLQQFRGQEAHVDSVRAAAAWVLPSLRSQRGAPVQGKVFAYVYKMDSAEHTELMVQAQRLFGGADLPGEAHDTFLNAVYREYIHGNALNPNLFPGLRQLEIDTV
jgi:hypothetical protein